MKKIVSIIVLCLLIPMTLTAQVAEIEFVETPEIVSQYLDDYLVASSLVGYLAKQQIETHCAYEWLVLPYSEEYALVCVLENIFDDSAHLFVEIGGDSLVDRKTLVILRDGAVIHDQVRFDRQAHRNMMALIPHVERQAGRYLVFMSIEDDGEVGHKTASIMIEPERSVEE